MMFVFVLKIYNSIKIHYNYGINTNKFFRKTIQNMHY